MDKPSTRIWAVASAVMLVTMIAVNGLANALPLNGVNTGQLSDELPNLFVPAGLTFSIWGLIYALLIGYVAAALAAAFGKPGASAWRPIDGALFCANAALNVAWILAWHWRLLVASMVVMLGILGTLVAMMEAGRSRRCPGRASRFFLREPVLVYLGWICVATIANATALLVRYGWDGFGLSDRSWTVVVIAAGAAIGVALVIARGAVASGLVVIWAYAGIVMKRQAADPGASLPIIVAAYVAIAALAAAIVSRLTRARRADATADGDGAPPRERLDGYLDDVKRNNVILQLALREIDEGELVAALAGLDDESRAAVYRNLSKRAAEVVVAELGRRLPSIERPAVEAGLARFRRLIADRSDIDEDAY